MRSQINLMRKKKILFLIPSLKLGGGAERVASILANKLSETHEVHVLTFYYYNDLYKISGKYYSLNEKLNSWRIILRPFKIFKFSYSISPDIIISFMDHANIMAIIAQLISIVKIPLIISVHCNPEIVYKDYDKYMNILIKIMYRSKSVKKIITVSKEIQNILIKSYHLNERKILTIYNGIDISEIHEMARERIKEYNEIFNDKEIVKFINVGRISEEKGHEYLIKAFSIVHQEIPNSKLFIIGEGFLKRELEEMIKENDLNNDIYLLGFRKNPFKYIKNSDFFVLSSKNEGLPTVLLETLACGIPIISTNCETGPKEILEGGKYGLLVRVSDSEDLAEKMIYSAKNKGFLKENSNILLERAKAFDLNNIIDEWIKLIDSFIN